MITKPQRRQQDQTYLKLIHMSAMYIRTQALLQTIPVQYVLATSQVVELATSAANALDGCMLNALELSETRVVTRETKRKPLEMVRTFTTDLVIKAIKSCRNSKAFGPDKLSIFHLKQLGPRAIEYITTLFNLSATTCRIPAIWKSSLIIPIPKPGKDTSQGTSYRPISLICPAAKVLESLFLPTINKDLIRAQDQHGFRREHSTTSALLQLTTDVAVGFNQRKPPDRTVCVAVDLSAVFDSLP